MDQPGSQLVVGRWRQALALGQVPCSQAVNQCTLQRFWTGQHTPVAQIQWLPSVVADHAASRFDQRHTGREIPRLKSPFPVAIQPACRDEGQIQCCGPAAPHSMGDVGEMAKLAVVVVYNSRRS